MNLTDPVLQETTEKFAFHTVSYSYLIACALIVIVAIISAIKIHTSPMNTGRFHERPDREAAIIGCISISAIIVLGNTLSLAVFTDLGPTPAIVFSCITAILIPGVSFFQISQSRAGVLTALGVAGLLIGLAIIGPHHKVMVEVASDDAVAAVKDNDAALARAIEASYDVNVQTPSLHADCSSHDRGGIWDGDYYELANTLTRHTCAITELENAASGDATAAPVVTVVTADDVLADYRVTYDPDTNTARLYADASAPAAPEPKQLAR